MPPRRGSVLLFVLWAMIAITVAAYVVGHLTAVHIRTSEHQLGQQRAAELARSGLNYARHLLILDDTPEDCFNDVWAGGGLAEGLRLDGGSVWLIAGAADAEAGGPAAGDGSTVAFGLVDESSKINVNTAPRGTLLRLPRMTPELADNIIAWRSGRMPAPAGETEEGQPPPPDVVIERGAGGPKGSPFETTDELLRVPGMTPEILFGEDANRNGVLDANEDDGSTSYPDDNRDGQLDRGLLGVITVYSRLTPAADEAAKKDINKLDHRAIQEALPGISDDMARRIRDTRDQRGGFRSLADLALVPDLPRENLRDWWPLLRVGEPKTREGLVNVLTASRTVLAALEPLDPDDAARIWDFVHNGSEKPEGLLWLLDLLDAQKFAAVVPLLTTRSERFSARVVAASDDGMYWCRLSAVLQRRNGAVGLLYLRDDTRSGPHLPEELLKQFGR